MEINPRQEQAINALKNRLQAIQNIDEIRDDLFSIMILDWINNATPNEPGIETEIQMKELVEGDHPGFQLGNQEASELLQAWLDFVSAFYSQNGGKRKRNMKKTRKLKKHTKKAKRGKSKRRLRGGAIRKANFNAMEKVKPFYAYAKLIEKNLLPNLLIDDVACAGAPDDLNLLFGGANGFALQFKCASRNNNNSGGSIYTFKLKYELSQYWEGALREKQTYKDEIKKEFLSIKQFDNEHIMKAICYFFFEPSQRKFQVYSTAAGPSQSINVANTETNPNYVQSNMNDNQIGPPFFGGLVLENVQKQFKDLPSDDMESLIRVFIQYVEGLEAMNNLDFIHKDIKPDNLMFNLDESGKPVAKIIDLGELYNVNTAVSSFSPASVELAPAGDITILQEITRSPPANSTRSRTPERRAIVESILHRYDLYCLAKSFLSQFNEGDEGNLETNAPAFYELLQNCIKEDHTERLSNEQAMEQAAVILSTF